LNDRIRFLDKDGQLFWESHPGPQSDALLHTADEVLYGGARGGGKTSCLIAWLAMGNRALPREHPCHVSYLNHKAFRALVLRRDATDLKEFVQEATAFFAHFGLIGGKAKDDPPIFKFASGATIYTNHLKNEDAFEKYKGWSLHKVGIEELTLIDNERSYLKVLGSVRSVIPDIKVQTFCTTNPDGSGSAWVRKRFVQVLGRDGKVVPWGTTMRDPYSGLTRVFLPAKLKDNPSLGADYRARLLIQDPKTRKAWLDGDWFALTGQYFSAFRPNGPHDGEQEAARHVIKQDPSRLMSWWPRYIGCDWGFKHNAAAYWLTNNQDDGRIHVYGELVRSGMGAEQLGAEIAQRSIPDLVGQPDLTIPLYLSHDAFNVQDVTKTRAELIQQGIESVLGAGSTVLLGNGANIQAMQELTDDTFSTATAFDSDARIVIHRAGKERIGVWQYLRSLLRWEPIVSLGQPNAEYARKLVEEPDGLIKLDQYLNSYRPRTEILPGILIWDNCPRLIEAMQSAIHDDNKPEDILEDGRDHSNDELDALRHALMMMRKFENSAPYKVYMQQRLNKAQQYTHDPNLMAQIYRKADSDYRDSHHGSAQLRLPRLSQRVH
jgi:hypothetical protein